MISGILGTLLAPSPPMGLGLLWIALAVASPARFCKETSPSTIFCVALSSCENTTTSASDLYFTISTRLAGPSLKGWTGVGLGESMEGSLMVISYVQDGNQDSSRAGTLVRTAHGHEQPFPLLPIGGPIISIVESTVQKQEGSVLGQPLNILTSKVVCHSCGTWHATNVDLKSSSQPFIWAANPAQDFSDQRGERVQLQMHGQHGQGYGSFWADLAGSFGSDVDQNCDSMSFPSVPASHTGLNGAMETVPSSDDTQNLDTVRRDFLWHIHGTLLAASFLFLYPIGIYMMHYARSGNYTRHWVIQVVASLLSIAGVSIGYRQSQRITFWHQYLGLSIPLLMAAQLLLGWRAHVVFLAIGRKNIFGAVHVFLGIGMLVTGMGNSIVGLQWRNNGTLIIASVSCLVALELIGLGWILWTRFIARVESTKGQRETRQSRALNAEVYALVGSDDEGGE